MNLVDILAIGNPFYWTNVKCITKNRMGIIKFSNNIIDWWKICGQGVGDNDIFYRCPIWIRSSNTDWGHNPLKSLCCRYEHEDFLNFVKRGNLMMFRGVWLLFCKRN